MSLQAEIKIEKITERNFEDFYRLFQELLLTQFAEYSKNSIEWMINNRRSHNNKEKMREIVKNISIAALGAFLERKIVGFIYGELPMGGISMIHWLAVEPQLQRQGIGKALLVQWENMVKYLGAHSIHLATDSRNLEFYKKLGYKEYGFDKNSYFGSDDYLFKKDLQEPKEKNFLR